MTRVTLTFDVEGDFGGIPELSPFWNGRGWHIPKGINVYLPPVEGLSRRPGTRSLCRSSDNSPLPSRHLQGAARAKRRPR